MEANDINNTAASNINSKLRGKADRAVLYRATDLDDTYVYRAQTAKLGEESGELEFVGWASLDGSAPDVTGYVLEAFFSGPDGAYVGPDQHGVYPVMVRA